MSSLPTGDVRALLRLAGELRELGEEPPRWRRHLLSGLAGLCGARAGVTGELAVAGPGRAGVRLIHREGHGVSAAEHIRFEEAVVWNTHGPNDAISGNWSRYDLRFTGVRRQLADDRTWYRSTVANEHFRRFDCDDFIVSMLPVPSLRLMSSIKLFRPWRDRPFGERERLLLELLADELARDWVEPPDGGPPLSPRLRQVLSLLGAGASEKEVAATLGLSGHTVHDYAKALHRTFRVRSRGELLARARPRRLRTHLVSEASG
jgi:DNA-binding CsgD family transcriptional regulator